MLFLERSKKETARSAIYVLRSIMLKQGTSVSVGLNTHYGDTSATHLVLSLINNANVCSNLPPYSPEKLSKGQKD
jgi:hypothetical protein